MFLVKKTCSLHLVYLKCHEIRSMVSELAGIVCFWELPWNFGAPRQISGLVSVLLPLSEGGLAEMSLWCL